MRIRTRSDTGRYSGEQTRYLHRGTRLSSFGIGIGNVLHRFPGTLTNGVVHECRRRARATGFLSGLIVHMNTAMRHRMHQIRHGTILSQNKHCQAAQVPLSARHRRTRGRIEIRFVLVIVHHPHKRDLRNHSRTTRDCSLLVGVHLRIAHPGKQFIRGGNLRQPPRLPGGAGEPFAFPIKEYFTPVRHKPRGLLVPKAQVGIQGREPAKPEHARRNLIRMGDRQTVIHTRQRQRRLTHRPGEDQISFRFDKVTCRHVHRIIRKPRGRYFTRNLGKCDINMINRNLWAYLSVQSAVGKSHWVSRTCTSVTERLSNFMEPICDETTLLIESLQTHHSWGYI